MLSTGQTETFQHEPGGTTYEVHENDHGDVEVIEHRPGWSIGSTKAQYGPGQVQDIQRF